MDKSKKSLYRSSESCLLINVLPVMMQQPLAWVSGDSTLGSATNTKPGKFTCTLRTNFSQLFHKTNRKLFLY